MLVAIIVGHVHLPQNIMFYKNSTDFNIVNRAKRDIKILAIKTHYMVIANNSDIQPSTFLPDLTFYSRYLKQLYITVYICYMYSDKVIKLL